MKQIYNIFAVLALLVLVGACNDNEMVVGSNAGNGTEVGVFGDEMRLCLNVVASDPIVENTRAVDPDGKTLQRMTLFCFDDNGLFLTTVDADVKGRDEDNLEGTFSATIPKTTRIIHLLANQNLAVFDKNAYVFKTEDDVLSALEGSAGMLIYWARIEAPGNLNSLYTDCVYTQEQDGKGIDDRTDAEAFVDWLTIETNPTTETHRGVAGKGHPIILLRNQAKFTIVSELEDGTLNPADNWKGTYFEVTGFVLCNTQAFGTVAPYHTEYGFPTYACSTFKPNFGVTADNVASGGHNWVVEEPVTLAERREKMSDIADVYKQREFYIFESNNLGTDPVDLILRGKNIVDGVPEEERYYYRVNIIDADGDLIKILRNHHYEIHISGNLNNGCLTFAEAVAAPPTNNVWISISDEVASVCDNNYILSVEQTKVLVETDVDGSPLESDLNLHFNVKAVDGDNSVVKEKLMIYWMEDDQKVSNTFTPSLTIGNKVTYDEATGDGTITLALNALLDGVDYERGSIVVKCGHLQRKIRVILMRMQQFVPAWVSAEVYGHVTGDKESRENVTVIFTIPQTCPEEMFPVKVLITTNGLDGRATTGQVLPIIRQGEEGYGEEFSIKVNEGTESETTLTDLGYKYQFTANAPGQYRLYFENILNVEAGAVEYVVLEAEHFELMTKIVTYADHKRKIILPQLSSYSITEDADEEDVVKYLLVPQKRFSPVVFDIRLEEEDGVPYTTIGTEEFLLYSSNLDHYPDDEERLATDKADYEANWSRKYFVTSVFYRDAFDCFFKPYMQSYWKTGGRIFGFFPRENKIISPDEPFLPLDDNHCFQIYMETNKPNSAEVVRVASNQQQSTSVKNDRLMYAGNTFRSTVFELANYRPFRFAAQVNGEGNFVGDDATSGTQHPEVVDNIEFKYLPDETVSISFDVTSFHTFNSKGEMISIDPFGTGFEIFIDAPMLKLEKGMNKNVNAENFEDILVAMFDKDMNGRGYIENKPKLEDLGNGRFVYRVDAMSYAEYGHWGFDDKAFIKDATLGDSGQPGERKTIHFKKKSIVSEGQITISANPEHVTYHSKTFKVTNKPISGSISYVDAVSGDVKQIPAEQFVLFTRVYDANRVGSIVVKSEDENDPSADTYYELLLRGEYEFEWNDDPIEILCQIDGKYYSVTIPDLATLYANPNITLDPNTDDSDD